MGAGWSVWFQFPSYHCHLCVYVNQIPLAGQARIFGASPLHLADHDALHCFVACLAATHR